MISTVATTELPGIERVHRGKVRDVYRVGDTYLLVSTDRLSAFDCVLPTAIPLKGQVLNTLSSFWFRWSAHLVKNHLITDDVARFPSVLGPHLAMLKGRSSLVMQARRVDVECVVRGYLSGSAWTEYQKGGPVWGHMLPRGLRESQQLPEPIFTPTTKADQGHDQPITREALAVTVGTELAAQLEARSLALYNAALEYARGRGIILADTKFEFGFVGDELRVIDEMLTPDSSRFWDARTYAPGGPQQSYDKQYVRDFLLKSGWNREPPAPALPAEVVQNTTQRYCDALEILTGMRLP